MAGPGRRTADPVPEEHTRKPALLGSKRTFIVGSLKVDGRDARTLGHSDPP